MFETSIEGNDIYLGFDCILNLENDLAHLIPEERRRNGDYQSLENFVLRTGAGLEQIIVLIRAGAFRFLGVDKKALLWEAHLLLNKTRGSQEQVVQLFGSGGSTVRLPALKTEFLEDLYDEIELLGFPVSGSMFDLAKSAYRGNAVARDLTELRGQVVRIVGKLVATKPVKPKQEPI